MPAQTALDITLNGDPETIADGARVADLLEEMGLDPAQPKGIAVALNDTVVRKSDWNHREIQAGDRIEVITARQGG